MNYKLLDNTIFIADSHFSENKRDLEYLLDKILSSQISCSDIILLGDMFDFLCYEAKYFINKNQNIINKLNTLSTKYKVYYFEGNHDYNLAKIFPNIIVFPRQNQPVVFHTQDNLEVLLSHGDIEVGLFYEFYCKIIRNKYLLSFLNLIDINNIISKTIEKKLSKKSICKNFLDFEKYIENKYKSKTNTIIVEGHYHQGKTMSFNKNSYINVPSLYCSKKFTRFCYGSFIQERY